MPQKKKPTNKQLEKLLDAANEKLCKFHIQLLKIQKGFLGLEHSDDPTKILEFEEMVLRGNPLFFYNKQGNLDEETQEFKEIGSQKSIFIEDKGITLIHTLNDAIVRRNGCNTIFSSHTANGESAPYLLIGAVIDIMQKYECNTFKSVWEKESTFETQERIHLNAFMTWITTLTYPQFECGIIGKTDADNNNSVSRLVLNFNCATSGYDAFFNNQRDLTRHEYYNEFIKLIRVKSFNFNDEKLDKIISDNEEIAYNLIKSAIEDNGGKLDTDIAIYALNLDNMPANDGIDETMFESEIPELPT